MATKARSTGQSGGGKAPGRRAATPRSRAEPSVSGPINEDYLALIRRFPLRPIRTEDQLDTAFAVIDELTDRDDLSAAEADYLDVLGDLVERYEDRHVEMPHVSDAEMLRTLMEEKGVGQADVVRGAGISNRVLSRVLNGRRALTRDHIENLSRYFGISPATFLNPV